MSGESIFVFGLLFATIVLFLSDRVRLDVVAIMVILVLMLSGLLSPQQALAGFGDPVVLLIGGLFVIGEGLFRTGIAYAVGAWLMRVAGTSETRLMVLLMLVVALLSAFMSSTGAVAIFIPIALSLCAKLGISPSRLLMPLAIASLLGGMLTLLGTPPNVVVSTQLGRAGMEPFGFFSFTPVGLLVLAVGIGYMLIVGRTLLPKGVQKKGHGDQATMKELAENYEMAGQLHRVRVVDGAKFAGTTVAEALLRTHYGVTVVGIERRNRYASLLIPALADSELLAGDVLFVICSVPDLLTLIDAEGLEQLQIDEPQERKVREELGVAEVMLPPASKLLGHTLKEAAFRTRHGLSVLAIQRKGDPIKGNIIDTKL
jgi:di/tricarboxylate transporter